MGTRKTRLEDAVRTIYVLDQKIREICKPLYTCTLAVLYKGITCIRGYILHGGIAVTSSDLPMSSYFIQPI